jgi:DNA polymerase-3 subunit beta
VRFSAPTKALLETASYAASVAATKSPKRVLEDVAFRVSKEEGVVVEATDLDVAVHLAVPDAKPMEDGVVVASAARVVAVLREVGDADVTVVGREGRLEVDTAGCHFRVNGDDPGEFPVLPKFPATAAFRVPCGVLRAMVRRTAFSTAREAGRFALHGVLMRVAGGVLELVGTDGRRLARATRGLGEDAPKDVRVIVGTKALGLLERVAADDATPVDVAVEERQVMFRIGTTVLASRLIDGAFPSYEEVIPKPSKRGFSIRAEEFATALRRASLLTTREAQSVQMDFGARRLTISSRAADVGEARVELEIPYEDAAERLGFNPSFLLDALKVMDPARDVSFQFTNGKSPGRLTDGEEYVYVVMPVSVE